MKQEHTDTFPVQGFSSRTAPSASRALDRWAVGRIQHRVAGARLRLVLWDGFEAPSSTNSSVATIVFKNRRALFSWLWDPELNFGEAYMFGAVDIRGDLVKLLEEIYQAWPDVKRRAWWLWQESNDVRTARENVHRHYDLGNEFYQLWLDRQMVYTCAYFPTPDCTLEEAQVAKMDRVCRKLQLKPGERVVEAGCGWGSLALFMAKQYGVNVSRVQCLGRADRLRAQTGGEGRAGRSRSSSSRTTTATSAAHTMPSCRWACSSMSACLNTRPSGGVIDRSLAGQGRGLLHFIGRNRPMPLNAWIRKRIFPGAYTPTLGEVFERVLEPQNFSVLDVENLRLHYAKTLEHWRRRFDASASEVASMFDDPFVRAWRLYLAGSQAAFGAGVMQLFQVVFARGGSNAIPWTREARPTSDDARKRGTER